MDFRAYITTRKNWKSIPDPRSLEKHRYQTAFRTLQLHPPLHPWTDPTQDGRTMSMFPAPSGTLHGSLIHYHAYSHYDDVDVRHINHNKEQRPEKQKKKGMMQGMNDSLASIQRREHIRSKGLSSWQPAKNIEVYRNCSRMQRRCWRGYKGLQNQTLSEVKSTYCETLCFPYLSYASRFCGSLSIW